MLSGTGVMRVALDARDLNREHLRGMGRCLWELLARGGRRGDIQWDVLADRPDLPLHLPNVDGLNVHLFECRGHRFHTWEQLGLPWHARRLHTDLLHCPSMRVPWWQPVQTVVTLCDMVPWLQDDPGWPRGWYADRLMPRAFRKCEAVITISESSKRDILRVWPELESKLHVVYCGVSDAYLTAVPGPLSDSLQRLGVRSPYLLYFGGSIPRKRVDWAIRVLDAVDDPDVQLVICGIESQAQKAIREGAKPQVRNRLLFAPFIAESELPSLYQNAIAVLYPTLYEGFGLPALEGQAAGTPVLFSEVSSLCELKGPAAVVLPKDDLDAWKHACCRLIAARGSAPVPIEASRVWARRFSWDVYTDGTLAVYRSVAAASRQPKHAGPPVGARRSPSVRPAAMGSPPSPPAGQSPHGGAGERELQVSTAPASANG